MTHRAGHHHYHILRLGELRRLYWAHTIKMLAAEMSTIFIPIYLYQLGYNIPQIMGYFLWFSVLWAVIQYPVLRFSNAIGLNRALGLSMFVQGLHILMLATITRYHWPLWLVALVWALFVALYWPSFRACFARSLLHKKTIGPAVGMLAALGLLAFGIAPAIGGAIATQFGIIMLYILALLCFIAAAIPLFSGPEIIRKESFNPKDIRWHRIWRDLVANMGDNIDDSVTSLIWPLFIFLLIPSYIGVGILSSIAVIASILIALYIGRRQAVMGTTLYLNHGTLAVTLANAVRLVTQSVGQIAGVNFFNGLGHALVATPYNSRYYQNADREPLLPYVFAMMAMAAVANILLFGILFAVSLVAPIKVVLIIGLLLAIPAGYTIRLMRA